MRPPPNFLSFNSPSPHPPGADGHHRWKWHVGRHCPYTNNIWCESVQALLRYRSKTAKMQKFPIDSHSNENFISPFSARRGPPTPKRGEDTFGTRVRPHAKFGVNWPAGCREIVDKKTNKCVSKTDTNPPFAFQIAFLRGTDFAGFLQGGSKSRDLQSEISVRIESNRRIVVYSFSVKFFSIAI